MDGETGFQKQGLEAASVTALEHTALAHLDAIVAAKSGGTARLGQRQLCVAMASGVDSGSNTLAEAGTGTGKTYAYLAVATAAIRVAKLEGGGKPVKRVVIVTATKALQEQLVNEDLPAVAAALCNDGFSFSFALLKGRNNYLCAAKHVDTQNRVAFGGALFDNTEGRGARVAAGDLDRIEQWVAVSVTGDRAEMNPDVSDVAWRAVSVAASECPGRKSCSMGDVCWAERAREHAKTVDIVVVNAALYATALASEATLFGDHQLVILDEAHQFDSAITDANTVTLSGASIRTAAKSAQKSGGDRELSAPLSAAADVLDTLCQQTVQKAEADSFDGVLLELNHEWVEVLSLVAEKSDSLATNLSQLAKDHAQTERASVSDARAREISGLTNIAQAARGILGRTDKMAVWASEKYGGRAEVTVAPIDVSGLLAATLWANTAVIACSATLKHAGSLDGYARRVGASNHAYIKSDVQSPFDYQKNALLYVAKHLPDPRDAGFAGLAAAHIGDLALAANGRTLSLHTSFKAMQLAADLLRDRLQTFGLRVLVQGEASREAIITDLRASGSSNAGGVVVFATQSFWTGVDVPGDGLICVIIDKLPFARPTDPLSMARRNTVEARGGNAFAEIDVPRAATLLAQGAGRLIRSETDRGVVAVLDQRLATKTYRKQLLAGLPPFARSIDADAVKTFLRNIALQAGS